MPETKAGICCPVCFCRDLPVAATRPGQKWIVRYRHCRNCGKPITTREKVVQTIRQAEK